MGLSTRTVWIITAAMVIALAGLVGLQASLLGNAMESREQSFRRNVLAAMSDIARGLETAETISATLHVVDNARRMVIRAATISDDGAGRRLTDSTFFFQFALADSIPDLDRHLLAVCESSADTSAVMFQYLLRDTNLEVRFVGDSTLAVDSVIARDSLRLGVIQRVIERIESGQWLPITDRIDPGRLDSLVRDAMGEYGIALRPVYAVYSGADTTVPIESAPGYREELAASEFRTDLFPHDILAVPNSLVLYFPGRAVYMWQQIGPMLAATVFFMVVIVGVFAYSVKTIVAQRRAARQMVDFVNNMTHEFKTPISTVALACEAILRPDVLPDPERVRRFSQVIVDENRRMRHQAEKILQMAALEEHRGHLQTAPVDLHEVIRNAVESISLQVGQRGGRITCDLGAGSNVMAGDELHLTGIIYNLLDNANKFSPESPQISISTEDAAGGIRITVSDQGVGISSEDQKHIFDKYFRVQRGNIHEAKGFGLGLSYVALMVRAHGGTVRVESEPGHGTRMILWFPVLRADKDPRGHDA
ncbi:MAG: HAMP domain-containing sensor histidine kinase [Candidatus Zixiibacteriota bacterium]